jgi:hypothetical protein
LQCQVFDVLPAANMPQTAIEPAFDSPDIFFKFVEPQDIHLGLHWTTTLLGHLEIIKIC